MCICMCVCVVLRTCILPFQIRTSMWMTICIRLTEFLQTQDKPIQKPDPKLIAFGPKLIAKPCMCICICICKCICKCKCKCKCKCICMCMYVCIYICMYMYMYRYIYIYTNFYPMTISKGNMGAN